MFLIILNEQHSLSVEYEISNTHNVPAHCPLSFLPQTYAVPCSHIHMVCSDPADTDTMHISCSESTITGFGVIVIVVPRTENQREKRNADFFPDDTIVYTSATYHTYVHTYIHT